MKKILALFITFLIILIMAGCDTAPLPVRETHCLEVSDVTFYASTVDGILGTKEIVMLSSPFGDVEVKESIYEKAVLDVYSHVCINVEDNVAISFASGRLIDLAIPEPPTVEVEVEVPVIEYVEVEVEVPVIEYVDREVIVEVEVIVQTHGVIDPDLWIAMNQDVYFYYIQENVIHLVYTGEDDMYVISVLFQPSFSFSDKVMVASIVHMEVGIYAGVKIIDTEFLVTNFDSLEDFIDDFILTNDYDDVEDLFGGE